MKKAASIVLALSIACSAFAGSAGAASKLEEAVDKLVGVNYSYGGTTTAGFDCSGFTSYVFERFGIELPRTSSGQATVGTKVAKADLIPGDLVFFNTSGKGISHVGIYLGNGKMAHSSTSKGVIIGEVDDDYYSKRYVTARRVLTSEQYTAIAVDAPAVQPAAATPTNAEVALETEAAELAAESEAVEAEAIVSALKEVVRPESALAP